MIFTPVTKCQKKEDERSHFRDEQVSKLGLSGQIRYLSA